MQLCVLHQHVHCVDTYTNFSTSTIWQCTIACIQGVQGTSYRAWLRGVMIIQKLYRLSLFLWIYYLDNKGLYLPSNSPFCRREGNHTILCVPQQKVMGIYMIFIVLQERQSFVNMFPAHHPLTHQLRQAKLKHHSKRGDTYYPSVCPKPVILAIQLHLASCVPYF